MPNLKKYKKIKLVGSELDIFLTTETGVFSWFDGKKIKFNPRPFSEKIKLDEKGENLVDFHVEIVKKIDALIKEREKETEPEKLDSTSQKQLEGVLEEIVERREPFKRKPEIPRFKTDIVFDDSDFEDELFEIEHLSGIHSDFRFVTNLEEPKDVVFIKNIDSKHVKDIDLRSRILGGQDEAAQKSFMSFPHIKFRTKSERAKQKADQSNDKLVKRMSSFQKVESKVGKKKTGKINNFTKTKKELEETKRAIEEKKRELEEAEEKAKAKEEELKRREKERLEKEKERKKLEEIESKKSMEEARKKEEESKRRFIEKQKKKREEERLKKLELKKARKEAKIKEGEMRKKSRMLEKKKKLEAIRALKEEKLKRKMLEKEKKKTKKKKIIKPKKKPAKVLKEKKTEDIKQKEKTKGPKPEKHHFALGKKETAEEKTVSEDEELIKVLKIADNLLEKLSDDVIDEFVQSEDFELYEKVISKYKIK